MQKHYSELDTSIDITNTRVDVVNIAMRTPMHLSFGEISSRPSARVTITACEQNEVYEGVGEGASLPEALFTDDSGNNIEANCAVLLGRVQAMSTAPTEAMLQDVQNFEFLDGGRYPTARLAVEMALLDVSARARGIAISTLIGVDDVNEVPYGKSIGGLRFQDMLSQSEAAIAQDAKKIKLKVSPDNADEVNRVVRSLACNYADLDIMVDANGGFDVTDPEQLKQLEALDALGLMMIEEPVSRVGRLKGLKAVIELRKKLPNMATPICLDDCLVDYATCKQALDEGIAEVINIKPGRIGSFLTSLELIDYAKLQGRQVMVGGMFEATPGRSMTTILGAYCLKQGFKVPGDLSLAQERLVGDLLPGIKLMGYGPNGGIKVPHGIGWGVQSEQ